ncbi:hypothetical protein AYL99_06395 [Fonsecaea erecta]|uniref:Mid2 domain-containing protein n=1 Tax=Fonsecaea erecta TaxID=1367422 RepID=A0A178ZH21_9EURO|nr:hypothetical protein AYL99_06395 [Fonsecaea erecta]OAP59097.1 hypothetical protein AYL99_06395 [Fonsecaea erecta]
MIYRSIPEARVHFLLLLLLVHLLANVTALEITYPKIGTIYPTRGPLDVQWQSTSDFDPTELAIYLATYSGQNLKSEQRCIVAVIDDGSTAITLSQPPPQGDSWTWMFYDDSLIISLGNNYVAESVHFQFQSATPTPTPAASTGTSSAGLSPGVAAAIGVGGTLVVVALGLVVGYCCFYRRRQQRKRETISAVPYTPGHRYSKQELDSKPGTAHGPAFSSAPINPPSYAGMKGAVQHEMEVYPGTPSTPVPSNDLVSPGAELSVKARHSHLPPQQHADQPMSPWNELALSPVRHEMYHDPHRVLPQELPGDMGHVQPR